MQTNPEQLKRQQAVLKHFGFYEGRLDGIWGPKTIEAKKIFEGDTKFKPGLPNNGLPFKDTGPYPKGVTMDYRGRLPMIQCEGIEALLSDAARDVAVKHIEEAKKEDAAVASAETPASTGDSEEQEEEPEPGLEMTATPLKDFSQKNRFKQKNRKS